jgi:hypothetical protein
MRVSRYGDLPESCPDSETMSFQNESLRPRVVPKGPLPQKFKNAMDQT